MFLSLALLAAQNSMGSCVKSQEVGAAEIEQVTAAPIPTGAKRITGTRISDDKPPRPSIFVKMDTDWAEYTLELSNEIVAQRSTPGGGYIIFGFHTSGGPGNSFEGLIFDKTNRLLSCPILAFPEALNFDEISAERYWSMEYLDLNSLSLNADGSGVVEASGDIDVSGFLQHVRFRYVTRDGGVTWSEAIPVKD